MFIYWQTFRQKVINCPAIANAWPLCAIRFQNLKMQNLKKRFNPLRLSIIWILLMMVLTPIFMYISNIGAAGGEQKPLITLGHMMVITIYGAPVVAILSSLLYRKWFLRNWWFVFIIILTIIITVWLTKDS